MSASAREKKPGVLPPPPQIPEDAPNSFAVPHMEPPPSSLVAMAKQRAKPNDGRGEHRGLFWLLALFVLGALITMYFRR